MGLETKHGSATRETSSKVLQCSALLCTLKTSYSPHSLHSLPEVHSVTLKMATVSSSEMSERNTLQSVKTQKTTTIIITLRRNLKTFRPTVKRISLFILLPSPHSNDIKRYSATATFSLRNIHYSWLISQAIYML